MTWFQFFLLMATIVAAPKASDQTATFLGMAYFICGAICAFGERKKHHEKDSEDKPG